MPELTDGVRGAIAQARLALAQAGARQRVKRVPDVPEDDAFTRSDIERARASEQGAA